jgi:type IV secretion system protein TrbL
MVAGGAAMGGARALGGAALGAVRSGTAMGSAASTAYGLGQEAAGNSSVGAGLSGVTKAAGNAVRAKASEALGIGEAASSGRQAAWNALNDTKTSPGQAQAGGGNDAAPAWARAMRAEQSSRHRRQMALHALQQGDRGGGAATPDIKERND